MNILTDTLPEAAVVGGKEYAIRSDFRTCLRAILAFEDPGLTGYEKQSILLSNLFVEIPNDVEGALGQALKFLDGGRVEEREEDPLRLYSFDKDASLIFSAFRQTHGIDLETASLHWWSFMALFSDLGSDTAFCNLINLRKRVKTGVASKEERQVADDMGDAFILEEPDTRTLEEKKQEEDFLRQVNAGRNHANEN